MKCVWITCEMKWTECWQKRHHNKSLPKNCLVRHKGRTWKLKSKLFKMVSIFILAVHNLKHLGILLWPKIPILRKIRLNFFLFNYKQVSFPFHDTALQVLYYMLAVLENQNKGNSSIFPAFKHEVWRTNLSGHQTAPSEVEHQEPDPCLLK